MSPILMMFSLNMMLLNHFRLKMFISNAACALLAVTWAGRAGSEPLTGGISAYASEESSAPLMQGKACDSLPSQWQGTWQGTIGREEQALQSQNATADTHNTRLSREGAKVSVNLVATNNGSSIAEMKITDNRRERDGDPNPDIIFFHNGNNGRLLVLPGAQIHTHTQSGDVYIGKSRNSVVMIGDNVRIGLPTAAQSEQQRIVYNNGGIQFNGPTEFNDRYFKADERINVSNGTQISAGRVDLGPAKMYPGGQTIDVTGNAANGFRIARPQSGSQSLPQDMLKNAHPAQTTTVMVAPGVFDQRSLSPVQGPDGMVVGYRQMVARYTALSPDRMLVQISVGNPDQNSAPDFTMSGYLTKSPAPIDDSTTPTK